MDDRVRRLESQIAILAERVADLELRVGAFRESGNIPLNTPAPAGEGRAFDDAPVQRWLALGGRTLVVLGGAYLLRALTEANVLSTQTGVALGLLYGAPWLVFAALAGARGAQLDALWHGLATALIGYPLVWEATMRFGVLAPFQSAALLGVLTAGALVLSAFARLQGLAWTVTLGALASAAGLAAATGDWISYTLLALALGLGTLWISYVRDWTGPCWVAATVGNAMLVIATGRGSVSGHLQGPLALQFLAFVGYVGSAAMRNLALHRRLGGLDIGQAAAATLVALGGSILLLQPAGRAYVSGLAALAIGATAYATAFLTVRVRQDLRSFVLWSTFALALTLAGTAVCAGAPVASVIFSAGAVVLAWAARPGASLTLNIHAIVYAVAAVAASGLARLSAIALLGAAPSQWEPPALSMVLAFVAISAVSIMPLRTDALAFGQRLPRLFLMTTLVWTATGLATWLAAAAGTRSGEIDPSALATIRTAVLVAATLVVARAGRFASGREAGWLTYPLLVVTGLKLLFVDLPLGRPGTLFAALALYGTALIVAPRLARKVRLPAPEASSERDHVLEVEKRQPVAGEEIPHDVSASHASDVAVH